LIHQHVALAVTQHIGWCLQRATLRAQQQHCVSESATRDM
jgi:hypothetical protein